MMRLVPAAANSDAVADPFAAPAGRRAVPLRPSDVPVAWHVVVDDDLRYLEAGAAEMALHLDTALALVLERELVRARLVRSSAGNGALSALDRVAAQRACVRSALSGADAVYLRALCCGADLYGGRRVVPPTGIEMCVSLPARLSSSLLAAGWPGGLTIRSGLSPAIDLEIASVCAGQTMSEWAAWTLLEL